jgi:hypothetical protein
MLGVRRRLGVLKCFGVEQRAARLDAVEASVDRGCDLYHSESETRGGGMQHLEGVSHGRMKSRRTTNDDKERR